MTNKNKFQMVESKDLIPYLNNARTHSEEQIIQIASSIKEFGFTNPILIDDKNGVIAGHGRLIAANRLNLKQIPCVVLENLTEEQKKAYVIADNNLALNADWNLDILKLEIENLDELDFDLNVLGFDDEFLEGLLGVDYEDGLTDDDEVPPMNNEPVSLIDDIWQLGNHRLMCADMTFITNIEKLMDGQKADLVFTDPPYGMFLDTHYDTMFLGCKDRVKTGKRFENVIGDGEDFKVEFINNIFSCFSYCEEIFLWGADYYIDLIHERNDGSWVVWDKRCDDKMEKVVGNTFELCWSKHKHKRMVARILWSGYYGMQKDDTKTRVHPTQKPVELIMWFFDQYNLRGKNNVVDLFAGSGSTLIACEKIGKSCFAMELSEKYVDTIIKRWQDFTGKKAIHIDSGKTYEELSIDKEKENAEET